jgi:hypothetical protein
LIPQIKKGQGCPKEIARKPLLPQQKDEGEHIREHRAWATVETEPEHPPYRIRQRKSHRV